MADKITTNKILGIGFESNNPEGGKKTTYLKIPNYKQNLTENAIKTAASALISNGVILDPYGNEYDSSAAVFTAYTENQTITALDIGWTDLS